MTDVKPGMSDDPPWLADAVEDAKLAFERSRGNLHQQICAALAAFLRAMPDRMLVDRHQGEDEHGIVIGDDGLTTHNLAAAIERLGAQDNQMQTGGRADGN